MAGTYKQIKGVQQFIFSSSFCQSRDPVSCLAEMASRWRKHRSQGSYEQNRLRLSVATWNIAPLLLIPWSVGRERNTESGLVTAGHLYSKAEIFTLLTVE